MQGLELSERYFEEFGRPMLESEFGEILPLLAVCSCGKGSEHFGYDDEISRDHDFEPGFMIMLPDETVVDRRQEFLLSRAYTHLPATYMGVSRGLLLPVGGNRCGVLRMARYFAEAVGDEEGSLSVDQWLHIPDYALAEATNGRVYLDNLGELTAIRQRLLDMPADVRLKRIAGCLAVMAQSGQYNYARCIGHGEPEAAQLAAGEFVQAAMKVYFLINHRYMPYYKWSFRALRDLPGGSAYADKLSLLICAPNTGEQVRGKTQLIEDICAQTAELIRQDGIETADGTELERCAYSVNDSISDNYIRNLNIFETV